MGLGQDGSTSNFAGFICEFRGVGDEIPNTIANPKPAAANACKHFVPFGGLSRSAGLLIMQKYLQFPIG
jgi:hypothetical protein